MDRKLNVIIKFGKYDINIKTIESDDLNKIVIFSASDKLTNSFSAINFIKSSINMINTEIGGKINSAIVLVENNSQLDAKLHTVTKELNLINGIVNQKDFNNSMKLIRKDFSDNIDYSLIHVQPVQYTVHGVENNKCYAELPFGKKGSKLTIDAVVTTISTKVFDYIKGIMQNSHLKIDYIATSAHAIPHETQSSTIIQNGGASIHIDNRATFVTVNYNNSTMKYKLITKGYSYILSKIKNLFNCNYEEANNLFYAYGNLDQSTIKIDKAIFIAQSGIHNNAHRISDLTTLLKIELGKILLEAKSFIDSITTNKLNITISGVCNTLSSISSFAKFKLDTMDVILYRPLSYICKEIMNVEYIGVLKYIDRYNENIAKDFISIVHTNPNTMRFFPQVQKVNVFKRLLNKIVKRGNYAQ
jgi:hypothetical protein